MDENVTTIVLLSAIFALALICVIANGRKLLQKRTNVLCFTFIVCVSYAISIAFVILGQVFTALIPNPLTQYDPLVLTFKFGIEVTIAVECVGFMLFTLDVFHTPAKKLLSYRLLYIIGWVCELVIYSIETSATVRNSFYSIILNMALATLVFALLTFDSFRTKKRLHGDDARAMNKILISAILFLLSFAMTSIILSLVYGDMISQNDPSAGIAVILGTFGLLMFYIGFFKPTFFKRKEKQSIQTDRGV